MSKSICVGGITNSPATLRYAQFSVVVSDKIFYDDLLDKYEVREVLNE